MRYEVSYIEHGHADAQNPFALKLLLGRLDDITSRLLSFQATEHGDGYRVSYRRRWAAELHARSEMEALRTFLHISGLPQTLHYRDIVIKQFAEGVPIEADDQRAGEAAA